MSIARNMEGVIPKLQQCYGLTIWIIVRSRVARLTNLRSQLDAPYDRFELLG